MARRRRATPLNFASYAAALAIAIVAFSAALTLWNIGNVPPKQALAAFRAAVRGNGAALLFARIVLGFVAIFAGTLAVLEVIPYSDPDLVPISLIVFLSAIIVEHLVGAQVRARIPVLFGSKRQRHG